MPLAETAHGALYYEVIDRVAPGEIPRDPILFHHGIGAWPGIWEEWIAALADRHKIVTFDMRGYGRSHVPAPSDPWSIEELIGDVFAVADAAGFARFHLVGESIGGTIGLAATLAQPARIATLTVSNGAHLGASIERVDQWRRQLDERGIKAWSDIFMHDRFYEGALSPARWATFARAQEAWRPESILNALGVLVGADLSPHLGAITCPVLLLHPDDSPFIPVPVAEALHRLLPGAQLHIFPHARHGLPYSHAAACVAELRPFLDAAAGR
ncbi:MAG TPA: alpha/beta hydrolase [Stellaceae bacterium]|nr:alpha/beta hydrolase [Stellaceae bacterium]